MSGSDKENLKNTFKGSPMPDFEAEMNLKPSPLIAVSKFSSHNSEREAICPICGGDMKDYITRKKCRSCHREMSKHAPVS